MLSYEDSILEPAQVEDQDEEDECEVEEMLMGEVVRPLYHLNLSKRHKADVPSITFHPQLAICDSNATLIPSPLPSLPSFVDTGDQESEEEDVDDALWFDALEYTDGEDHALYEPSDGRHTFTPYKVSKDSSTKSRFTTSAAITLFFVECLVLQISALLSDARDATSALFSWVVLALPTVMDAMRFLVEVFIFWLLGFWLTLFVGDSVFGCQYGWDRGLLVAT